MWSINKWYYTCWHTCIQGAHVPTPWNFLPGYCMSTYYASMAWKVKIFQTPFIEHFSKLHVTDHFKVVHSMFKSCSSLIHKEVGDIKYPCSGRYVFTIYHTQSHSSFHGISNNGLLSLVFLSYFIPEHRFSRSSSLHSCFSKIMR